MNRLLQTFLVLVAIVLALVAVQLPASSLDPSSLTYAMAFLALVASLALTIVICRGDFSHLFYSTSTRRERP